MKEQCLNITLREDGLGLVEAIIGLAVVGIVAAGMAAMVAKNLGVSAAARDRAKLEDIRIYLREQMSCQRTLFDTSVCDSASSLNIAIRAEDGAAIVPTPFGLIGREFEVRGRCGGALGPRNRLTVEYRRIGPNPLPPWRNLFAVPVECADPCVDQVIDFEPAPGFTPVDGQIITNQFRAKFGVTFSVNADPTSAVPRTTGPRIAVEGGPITSHVCSAAGCPAWYDGVVDLMGGKYFLTDDGCHPNWGGPPTPGNPAGYPIPACWPRNFPRLTVSYDNPVKDASGYLIDVDNIETWNIMAYAGAMLVSSQVMTGGGGLMGDGRMRYFRVGSPTRNITRLVLQLDTASMGGGGMAFDRFSPAYRCDP